MDKVLLKKVLYGILVVLGLWPDPVLGAARTLAAGLM